MKSVKQKIESALAGGDNNYAFLDSDELNTLVRNKRWLERLAVVTRIYSIGSVVSTCRLRLLCV